MKQEGAKKKKGSKLLNFKSMHRSPLNAAQN